MMTAVFSPFFSGFLGFFSLSGITTRAEPFAPPVETQATTAAEAIAVWTFPDGGTATGVVVGGVVAYHHSGVAQVGFSLDGGPTTYVTQEKANPLNGGEFEFIFPINTTVFPNDSLHVLSATVYPVDPLGIVRALPDRRFYVDNGSTNGVWYVDSTGGSNVTGTGSSSNPFATIDAALESARSGDKVRVRSGTYELSAEKDLGFTQYVTVEPDSGASVKIDSVTGGAIGTSFLRFVGIDFDWKNAPPTGPDGEIDGWMIASYAADHLWFRNCIFRGPLNRYNNYLQALRTWGSFEHLVVERCAFFGVDRALGVQSETIARGNRFAGLSSDILNFTGERILFTGNEVWNVTAPKLYIKSVRRGPYDVSTNRSLTLHNWDEGSATYTTTTVADVGSKALFRSQASTPEIVASLMADPAFDALFTAEDSWGYLKITVDRTNTKQHLYVSGPANVAFGFTQVSTTTEAQGSGQHADLLQSWTATKDVVARNNDVHDCGSQFLLMDNDVANFALVNNLLEADGGPWAITLTARKHDNVLIEFNTVYDSPNSLINVTGSVLQTNLVVRNNIFGDRAGNTDDSRPGRVFNDNIYDYHNGGIVWNLLGGSLNVNSLKLVPSPLLLFWQGVTFSPLGNEYSGDFHLRLGHPAINSGDASSRILYDLEWKPRDTRPDVGCYEFGL
jgi:hypothetical protein